MQPGLSSSPPWSSSYQWPWTMGVFQYLSSPILPLHLTRLVTAPPQNDFFGSGDTLFLPLTNYFSLSPVYPNMSPVHHPCWPRFCHSFYSAHLYLVWNLHLEREKLGALGATHSQGICNLAGKVRDGDSSVGASHIWRGSRCVCVSGRWGEQLWTSDQANLHGLVQPVRLGMQRLIYWGQERIW